MSTKIYNGFRINTSNFLEIHEMVQRFRAEITPIMEEKFYEMVCRQMVFRIDEDIFDPNCNKSACYLSDAIELCTKRHAEVHRTGVSDPFFDFEFSMTLIPYGNITLGIFYEDRGYKSVASKLWMDQTGVSDYAYWNNVDTPDEISEEDWARRGEIWDEALGSDTPNKRGYTWELFGPRGLPFPTWEQISKHLDKVPMAMRCLHMEHILNEGEWNLFKSFKLPEITRKLALGL